MKYIMLIADGMADHRIPLLEGKTPLQVASTPNMDALAREGFCGVVATLKEGGERGSDVALLSLLGYEAEKVYTGRGPLEAASKGIILKGRELAFRLNLVTINEGRMEDYSAGHISSKEAVKLVNYLQNRLGNRQTKFVPGLSYRHLLITTHSSLRIKELKTYPPHDIIGRPIKEYLPQGRGSNYLRRLMELSKEILSSHPLNLRREKRGLPPANMIWIWGGGGRPRLESFFSKYRVKGAVISAVDVIKGIGKYLGMEVIKVRGATGDLDTNYRAKGKAVLKALKKVDFVLLHVEAPDEASHRGEARLKVEAIENFDRWIVGLIRRKAKGARIFVGCDHVTSTLLRTHTTEPVPFLIWGGKEKHPCPTFSEASVRLSGGEIKDGKEIMKIFLG